MSIACSKSAFNGSLDESLGLIHNLGFDNVEIMCIPEKNHIVPSILADKWNNIHDELIEMLTRHRLNVVAVNIAVESLHTRNNVKI